MSDRTTSTILDGYGHSLSTLDRASHKIAEAWLKHRNRKYRVYPKGWIRNSKKNLKLLNIVNGAVYMRRSPILNNSLYNVKLPRVLGGGALRDSNQLNYHYRHSGSNWKDYRLAEGITRITAMANKATAQKAAVLLQQMWKRRKLRTRMRAHKANIIRRNNLYPIGPKMRHQGYIWKGINKRPKN